MCGRFEAKIEDVRSDKRSKTLIQVRMLMAILTRRFRAASMASLGRHIFRDGTSLAKLARKSESDSQLQILADELSKELIAESNGQGAIRIKSCA